MQKVTRSPSYLILNPHSYCFRMIVPKDLQSITGKRELRYSLRTGYLSIAKSRARLMAGRVQRLFNELRRNQSRFMELSYQQICEIVAKHLERAKALMDEPFGPDDGKRPFDDEASLKEYVQGLDDVRTDIQVEITTGTYRRVKENAISLLNEFGVSIDDIDEDRVMG